MKTLLTHRAELEHRIANLTAADQPRWGTMAVGQMLAHLADSCRLTLGEKQAAPVALLIHPTIFKWLALRIPLRWARNFSTVAEADQCRDGTPPTTFEADRATVVVLLTRIAAEGPHPPHPYFGTMTAADWQIHAYRHTDHHLRQFGR